MKKQKTVIYTIALFLAAACIQGCGSKQEASGTLLSNLPGYTEVQNEFAEEQSYPPEKPNEAQMQDSTARNLDSEQDETRKPNGGTTDASKSEKETSRPGNTAGSTPSTTGALHVEGTQLVGSNGEPVQLRGISTHGLAWFPQYVNEECFRQLKTEWNVNVIRLAMYTAESGGYCTDGNSEQLKTLIHSGVKYTAAQDMYVIIDWHILSDSNPNTHLDEAKSFFDEMSRKYAAENHVIYEICNEPNGGTSWSQIKSYAKEVISVIRANDEDAVILVGTPNWSQYVNEAAQDPITEYDNLMYTLHFYAATHTDDLRSKLSSAVESGLPVFVSEYGICDASGNGAIDEDQANKWVDLLNHYNISYVAWNLSNKNETSALLSSSCSKTSRFTEADLSASGRWLYRLLTGEQPPAAPETVPPANTDSNTKSGSMTGTSADSTEANSSSSIAPENVSLTTSDLEITANERTSWEADGKKVHLYDLTIKNISQQQCTQWAIDISFQGDITLTDGWNGDYTVQGSVLHITSKDYNGTIAPGSTVSDIGFIVAGAEIAAP